MTLRESARDYGMRLVWWLTQSSKFLQGVVVAIAVGGWLMYGYMSLNDKVNSQREQIVTLQIEVVRVTADALTLRNQIHDLDVDLRVDLNGISQKLESMSKKR